MPPMRKRAVNCWGWYHKALKTGAQIERSQLSTAPRIQSMLAVCAVVAVRLLKAERKGGVEEKRSVTTGAVLLRVGL